MKKSLIIIGGIIVFAFWPKLSLAATLNFSPSSGSYSVGSTFSVSVRANTQGADVNTAEANILYSTETLELVSVKQGSTFYLSSPGSPSKSSGTAYFSGGLPSPGYNGSTGSLGTLTFRAKAVGTATVSVTGGHILLNDGNGTDAYTSAGTARFTIIPPPVAEPVVSSTTHPNPDSWYTKSTVELSWSRPTNAYGFSFELDQEAETIPDNTLDTTITTTKTYADLKDGIWYFHIKARPQASSSPFGATTHFRIQIDTQKPLLFDIRMVGQSDLNDVTRTPTVTFEAKDELSGIDHYDVLLDGTLVQAKAESPFTFTKLDSGPHIIRVLAYDKAGNDRKSELPIIASAPAGFLQRTLTLPIYTLLFINVLILLLIIVLVWFLIKKKKSRTSDEVAAIQAQIDESLEQLKRDINQKLIKLAGDSEIEAAKEVVVKVNKARKKIDRKIGTLKKVVKKSKLNDKILE